MVYNNERKTCFQKSRSSFEERKEYPVLLRKLLIALKNEIITTRYIENPAVIRLPVMMIRMIPCAIL